MGREEKRRDSLGLPTGLCLGTLQQAAEMQGTGRKLRRNSVGDPEKWGMLLMGHLLAGVYYFWRWEGCLVAMTASCARSG